MRVRSHTEFASGIMFLAIAGGFLAGSRDLSIGTGRAMGPGYFPTMVGLLLAAVGAVIIVRSFLPGVQADRLERWYPSKLVLVVGSVVAFALLLPNAGLVVAIAAMVMISSMASDAFSWRVALANAIVLSAMAAGIFVYGLGLLIPLWPRIF